MSRSLRLILFILFSSINAQAIEAVLSHTTFYLPDTANKGMLKPYVEVVWQIDPQSLHYVWSKAKTLSSMVLTDLVFSTDTGVVREDKYTLYTPPKSTQAEVLGMNIMKLHRYGLPYGFFTIKFTLTDILDTTDHFVYTDTLTINDPGTAPYCSGIELLDTVYYAAQDNVFTRNDKVQVPFCSNFLDERHKKLHYYFELYNTGALSKMEYPLTQHVFISQHENGTPYPHFEKIDTIPSGQVVPVLGDFKLTTLVSGNYYINVSLVSALHQQVAVSSFFFQRYNKTPEKEPEDTIPRTSTSVMENVTLLDLSKTFVAKYTFAQVHDILKMLIPVTDQAGYQAIKGFLKKPDEMYMRYFIYNFFASQDKNDPKAAWDAYASNVREVNKLYGTSTTPGYEADRGIVYLRYGKPTEQLRIDNEAGTNPYEIWVYEGVTPIGTNKKVGNGVFLFYRTSEYTSDYALLHSTVPGELRNPKWRNSLYTSQDKMNSYSSKAEEYIGTR